MEVLNDIKKIGRLDRVIALVTPVMTRTATGASEQTSTTSVNVWAQQEFTQGESGAKEIDSSGKLTDFINVNWYIRYRTVTPENYILYNSQIYDIIGVQEMGRRKFLKLTTVKRT